MTEKENSHIDNQIFSYRGERVEEVAEYRYLGVIIH